MKMRRTLWISLFFLLFSVISISTISASEIINISSCGIINSSGYYKLNQSLFSNGTCFLVKANNVVIDGSGFLISGNSKAEHSGLFAERITNLTVKNLSIENFGAGLRFIALTKSRVENFVGKNNEYGLRIITSRDCIISNSLFENNTYGLYSSITSFSQKLENNTIARNKYGVYLTSGSNYNLIANVLFLENEESLVIQSSLNNLILNTNITSSKKNDIVIKEQSTGNIFKNVHYNFSKEFVEPSSNLERFWTLQVFVFDQDGIPIENARVEVRDANRRNILSGLTNKDGLISSEVQEYKDNGKRKISNNPFVVRAVKSGFSDNSTTQIVSQNMFVNLTLRNLTLISPDEANNNSSNNQTENPESPQNVSEQDLILSNFSLNPTPPILNNGSEQNISISFSTNFYPINVTIFLENFQLTQNFSIVNSTNFPIYFNIPANLNDGNFSINLKGESKINNSSATHYLGLIIVKKPSLQEQQTAAGSTDGGSRWRRPEVNLTNSTNLTSNFSSQVNNSLEFSLSPEAKKHNLTDENIFQPITQKVSPIPENISNPSLPIKTESSSLITGGVVGALRKNWMPLLLFLLLIGSLILIVVRKKKKAVKEAVLLTKPNKKK